jgi:hypothetical protein
MPRHPARLALALAAALLAGGCRAPLDSDITSNQPPPSGGPLLPLRIGSIGPDFATGVVTDPAGNAFVAGYFAGSVDFDGSGSATVRTASGPYDISIASYASDGSFRWVFTIGGTGADIPYSIKLAPDGSLYLTGVITTGAICNGHVLASNGDRDILLLHVSAAGICLWGEAIGSTGDDEGHDLALDSNGDLLVTGLFSGTVDFDPGPGLTPLTSRGAADGFVARYAADGTYRNVAQFGGAGDDAGNAIAVRGDGDVIVAGGFNGTVTLGTLAPQQLISAGGLDFFVARLASTLSLEWAERGGGGGNDLINSGGVIAADNGTTYVTGTFSDVAAIGPVGSVQVLLSHGDADVFVASFDGNGNLTGPPRSFGGAGTDGVAGFTRDAVGNLYLTGSFQQSVDFDPGAGTHVVNALGSTGAADGYLLSLTAAGDLRWINPTSASVSGDTYYGITSGVALASDGTLWSVGRFFGLVDFDPGSSSVSRQSVGDADQFIARYDQATGAIVQ